MKKLLFLILLTFGIGLAGGKSEYFKKKIISNSPVVIHQAVATPIRLTIQKIGISANIEEVGLDQDLRMDVPKSVWNSGWYIYGPKPGEVGSSVIAGHYDDEKGPAIFYKLKTLLPGDYVNIVDLQGKERSFEVLAIENYSDAEFPLEKIFDDQTGKYLNLITCDGVFDNRTKNYQNRTVVFTKLREE